MSVRRAAMLALVGLVSLAPASVWAVKVAPQIVVIGARDRGAELTLVNPGERPVEVDVQVLFGYETADTEGTVATTYPAGPSPRSVVDWVRVWPRRVRLAAGQQQSVRLLVKTPPGVKDFEGWGRVQIREQGDALTPTAGGRDVQLQLGVATQQRVPLFVRRGNPRANVRLDSAQLRQVGTADKPELEVRYHVEVTGGAAFVGEAVARVIAGESVLGEATKMLAVFDPGVRLIRVPYVQPPDNGEVVLELRTRRTHPALQPDQILGGDDGELRIPVPR